MEPTYYPSDEKVEIELFGNPEPTSIPGPFISTGSSELTVSSQVELDKYNSEMGAYSDQPKGEAALFAKDDVTLSAAASVNGDLQSEGDVVLASRSSVSETIYHDGRLHTAAGASYSNEVDSSDGVPQVENKDSMIQARIDAISSADNPSDGDISRLEDGNCGSDANPCVLEEGRYALDDIELWPGQKLVLKPNGDTISIAVQNGIFAGPPLLSK